MGQDEVAAIGLRHGANICSTFFVMQCVQKSEGCRRSLLYMAPLCLATSEGLMLFLFGVLVTQLVKNGVQGNRFMVSFYYSKVVI